MGPAAGATGGSAPAETFGRYRLLERIGSGGMAEVYRAVLSGPMGFEKVVAVKRVHPHLTRDNPGLARAFINEARLGGLLQHPHLVQVLDFDEVGGVYYLAMEFVEGWTLDRLMEWGGEGGLPAAAVADLAIQVCDGLHYAHTLATPQGQPLGLIHRDLKPANVMVDRRGSARILDFGIAKAAMNLFQTTATGITRGTPRYMSPEQVEGEPLDARSDLFALGVCLFEALTGEALFQADGIGQLLLKVLKADVAGRLPTLRERAPALAPVVEALLRRKPGERPRDAEEARRALVEVRPTMSGPSLAELAAQVLRDPPGPRAGAAPDSAMSLDLDGTAALAGSRPSPLPTSFFPELDLDAETGASVSVSRPPEPTPRSPSAAAPRGEAPPTDPVLRPAGRWASRWPWLGTGLLVVAAIVAVAGGPWRGRDRGPGGDPGAQVEVAAPTPPTGDPGEERTGPSPAEPPPVRPGAAPPGPRDATPAAAPSPDPAGAPGARDGPSGVGNDPVPPAPAVDAAPVAPAETPPPPTKAAPVRIFHRAVDVASVGTSRPLVAEVRGGEGEIEVRCRYRAPGGEWRSVPLAADAPGRFRGALDVTDRFLHGIEYYLEVADRTTGRVIARDGDPRRPHRVTVY